MATKEDKLFVKDNQQSFYNSSSASNNLQFTNLNLNQHHRASEDNNTLVHSESKSKQDKQFASFKAGNFVTADNNHSTREKLWNKSSSNNSCLGSFTAAVEDESQKRWKNDKSNATTTSSTLSLHIAAYENSIEAASNEKRKQKSSTKKSNLTKALTSPAAKIQDPFEFPRQMQDNGSNNTPEVMQFKASQRMFSPYQDAAAAPPATSDNNSPSVAPNVEEPEKAEFNFDGLIKVLQIASLTPSTIAKKFRIYENSLGLTDNDGASYEPEGKNFVPPLKPNKSYEVDGIPMVINATPNETQIALRNTNNDLQVIQGTQGRALIDDVIASCRDLDDSANMLYHGPLAVVMVQQIAILSCCAPDAKLDTATLKAEIKARLADPGSFRTSLIYVANKMCSAFRDADYAMKKICACTTDLPSYFNAILEAVLKGDDESANKNLKRAITKVESVSNKCIEMATMAKEKFDDVILDIDALIEASSSSKTVNDNKKKDLADLKEVLTTKREEMKKYEEELKKETKEAQEEAKKAFEDYHKTMKESPKFGELFFATLGDALVDAVNAIPHLLEKSSGRKECVERPNLIKNGMEMGLIKSLSTIGASLSDAGSLTEATVSDYISSLKAFQHHAAATSDGVAIFHLAQDVQNFLTKYKSSLVNGSDDVALKKEISTLKDSIRTAESRYHHAQEQKKNRNNASDSCAEQIRQAHSDKLNAAKNQFNIADSKAEARRKELNESRKELTEIICKLKSIDINTADLTEILQNLVIGIDYLSQVKKNWEYLVQYFRNIKIVVDELLTSNIRTFIEEARDPALFSVLLQSALKATAYSIKISSSASLYSAVSGKYIMPVISSIGEEMTLGYVQAKKKHGEIEAAFKEMQDGVQELIEEKVVELEKCFHERIEHQRNNMAKAVKDGAIASAKAIQR